MMNAQIIKKKKTKKKRRNKHSTNERKEETKKKWWNIETKEGWNVDRVQSGPLQIHQSPKKKKKFRLFFLIIQIDKIQLKSWFYFFLRVSNSDN